MFADRTSYPAHTVQAATPVWMDSAGLYGYVLGRTPQTAADRRRAAQRYAQPVADGRDAPPWTQGLNRQIYLGDDDFVERMQRLALPTPVRDRAVPKAPRSQSDWLDQARSREEALHPAYTQSGLTMTAMAAELGVTVARVSQWIAREEAGAMAGKESGGVA